MRWDDEDVVNIDWVCKLPIDHVSQSWVQILGQVKLTFIQLS